MKKQNDGENKGLLEKIHIIAGNDRKNSNNQIEESTKEFAVKSKKELMEEAIRLENERNYFAMEYLFWSILIFAVLFFQSNLDAKAAGTQILSNQVVAMEVQQTASSDLLSWTIMIGVLMVIMAILYVAKKIQEKHGKDYKSGIQYHKFIKF